MYSKTLHYQIIELPLYNKSNPYTKVQSTSRKHPSHTMISTSTECWHWTNPSLTHTIWLSCDLFVVIKEVKEIQCIDLNPHYHLMFIVSYSVALHHCPDHQWSCDTQQEREVFHFKCPFRCKYLVTFGIEFTVTVLHVGLWAWMFFF